MNLASAHWHDLTEQQPDDTKTPIELVPMELLHPAQKQWRERGLVVLNNLIPHELLDAYVEARARLPKDRSLPDNYWAGWHYPTPFIDCRELLDVATNERLMLALNKIVGVEMGLHLALTGWVSTERNWHQDTYLNPDFLWSHYAAVWIALDDVSPDSGPFQFVPGSHLWPSLRREKLFQYLTPEERNDPAWPTFTQGEVARICEEEMERRQVVYREFVPSKGEVLIWHSNLLHRGSPPKNPEIERRALICHYSSLSRRRDMNQIARNPRTGQLYFDFPPKKK